MSANQIFQFSVADKAETGIEIEHFTMRSCK